MSKAALTERGLASDKPRELDRMPAGRDTGPRSVSAVTTAYALAYTLIVAATFGPRVVCAVVCVLLPLVAVMAWRRA